MSATDIEKYIIVKGAREHNLKNVSVKIPKSTLTVITGLSGSGKSSLAFDTIYAEGQRRYVESLSVYARQFLDQLTKPNIDSIEGLAPAISIEQRIHNKNPRSTVGTITEIYDYLRLLYAKVAKPFSEATGEELSSQTPSEITEKILKLPEKTRIQILAPIVTARKGEHKKEIENARKSGFTHVKINEKTYDLVDPIKLDKNKKNSIAIVVDRLVLKKNINTRVDAAIEKALNVSKNVVCVDIIGQKETLFFNTSFADSSTGFSLADPEPRLFSFNSPIGACPKCKGLGYKNVLDPELIVPDKNKSLEEGALESWTGKSTLKNNRSYQALFALAKHYKFDITTPFYKLPEKIKKILFYGSGKEEIQFRYVGKTSSYRTKQAFEGVIPILEKKLKEASNEEASFFEQFFSKHTCTECDGKRLNKEALAYRFRNKNIAEINAMTLEEAQNFFNKVKLTKKEATICEPLLKEINSRLMFLANVGLDYLSLSRTAGSLSGGEIQRVRLATQIGSSLIGVLYVLDEPSIGLHQRDNDKLLESLNELKNRGNTVIVVEHDRETIEQADFVIDMGPGAGNLGGNIISTGSPKEILADKNSITGRFLTGKDTIPLPKRRRPVDLKRSVKITKCEKNNLKSVDATFPLGTFICITGVSGSGKSTLVLKTLVPAIKNKIYRSKNKDLQYKEIFGVENIDKVINVDQSPIGRTPRSNPATYTGVFTHIRNLFAQTKEAQIRGFKTGRFSFNVKDGRCDTCEGAGLIRLEMHFLPDIYVPCHICNGSRYNRETLAVKYKEKSIADVLSMTISEAYEFFDSIPNIKKILKVLVEVGLGYITLGQSSTTLSGGEAQRMKLAKELSKRSTGKTIYVLDEPSTGLHFSDINKLLEALHKLVNQGNTVIVIEHNLDILKHADYIVDIGPEGGKYGGELVAAGTPEEVAKNKKSLTGKYLKEYV